MVSHREVMSMLHRNADYNDYKGSTIGAGYIGGGPIGGCMHCGCGSGYIGGCMNCGCGSGYIGGFKGERAVRKMLKERIPYTSAIGKTNYRKLMKEELEGYLGEHPKLLKQYQHASGNRKAARSRYNKELQKYLKQEREAEALQGVQYSRGTRRRNAMGKYRQEHPRMKREKKGCMGLKARKGLHEYCEFRERNPGMSRDQLATLWAIEKSNNKGVDSLSKKQRERLAPQVYEKFIPGIGPI